MLFTLALFTLSRSKDRENRVYCVVNRVLTGPKRGTIQNIGSRAILGEVGGWGVKKSDRPNGPRENVEEAQQDKKITGEETHKDVLPHLRGARAGGVHETPQNTSKRVPHWNGPKTSLTCGI